MATPQDKKARLLPANRLPLAVAVTGHRDIDPEDEPKLRDRIRERLIQLQAAYPASPLLALSGLAEGADMVFAEAALECGVPLWAVLPALPETFARECDTPVHPKRDPAALRRRFETLRGQCDEVVVAGHGYLAEDPRRHTFIGAYLVRRCHVLFALWNGDTDEAISATTHVVRLARQGVPNRYLESASHALDAPDAVVVHHLRTPRPGQWIPNAFDWEVLEPPACAGPFRTPDERPPLDHLENFNRAAGTLAARNPQAVAQSRLDLGLSDARLIPAERRLQNAFALADALANARQRQSRYVLDAIYGISAAMLVLFALHTNVMPSRWSYVLYYLIFVAGYLLYTYATRKRMHHCFVDYRGLAEGLRVQLVFHLAGVRRLAADLYLRKQRAELTWLRQTMRVLEIGDRRTIPAADMVLDCWIKAQGDYFRKAEARDRKTLRRYRQLLEYGFYGGLAVGAFGLVLELADASLYDSVLVHWVFLLTGLLAALAALAGSYAARRGFEQHIRAYVKMGTMFRQAAQRIRQDKLANKPFAFRTLVLELGREALAESGQWVLHHRDLPPDAPTK